MLDFQNENNKFYKEKGEKKGKYFDYRIFIMKKNFLNNDKIFPKINNNINSIKNNTNILLGIKKDKKKLNYSSYDIKMKKNNQKNNNIIIKLNRTNSLNNKNEISTHSKNILKNIYKNINYIKNSTHDIVKMNGLYLEKINKNNKNEDLKNYLNKSTNNLSLNLTSSKYEKTLSSIISKNLIKNFSYVNDNYRNQLNNAFLKFNPKVHYENLYYLQQVDSNVKNDILELRKTIDEDIKEITNHHYFKKLYEKIYNKNRNFKNNNNKTFEKGNKLLEEQFNLKYIYNEKIKKNEKKKKIKEKKEKLEEMEILKKSFEILINKIDNKEINKLIDKNILNYIINNYNMENIKDNKNKIINVNYKEFIDKMVELKIKNLNKLYNNKEIEIKTKFNDSLINFNKKIKNLKDNFIEEINFDIDNIKK